MFRHVVVLRWKDGTTADQRAAAVTRVRALPSLIPEIRRYVVGEDVGLEAESADLAIVADFDDAASYVRYRDHPAHLALIDAAPMLGAVMVVQHTLPD